MGISVRAGRASDADAVAALTHQLGYEMSATEAVGRLPHILSKDDHHFLIAEADGRAVGWLHAAVSLHIDSEPCVSIEGLVVDRDHRGQGVGKALLSHAEEWTKARGCSIVRLRSTSTRTKAHRFYEHLGYTNVKTQYSFAKGLDAAGREAVKRLAPRVDN